MGLEQDRRVRGYAPGGKRAPARPGAAESARAHLLDTCRNGRRQLAAVHVQQAGHVGLGVQAVVVLGVAAGKDNEST